MCLAKLLWTTISNACIEGFETMPTPSGRPHSEFPPSVRNLSPDGMAHITVFSLRNRLEQVVRVLDDPRLHEVMADVPRETGRAITEAEIALARFRDCSVEGLNASNVALVLALRDGLPSILPSADDRQAWRDLSSNVDAACQRTFDAIVREAIASEDARRAQRNDGLSGQETPSIRITGY